MHAALEVLLVFTRLGLTSFGGPVAHLGYFREEFVLRRRWMTEEEYADLVALCQFLPGPASSQVGMAVGLRRAGHLGMFLAWLAFTLPSAVALAVFAFVFGALGGPALAGGEPAGWIIGLGCAVVAVVAQAVLGMAGNLASGRLTAAIAVGAFVLVTLVPHTLAPVGAILLGAALASAIHRRQGVASTSDAPEAPRGSDGGSGGDGPSGGNGGVGSGGDRAVGGPDDSGRPTSARSSRGVALGALALFVLVLVGLPIGAAVGVPGFGFLDTYYRAGSLVFGGGHVVLPLLEGGTVGAGTVGAADFLAGYGAAQAVPGPLFTFAAFLGVVDAAGPGGVFGGLLALLAVFLPAALLVLGVLPFWEQVRTRPGIRRAMVGANAAVVGILAAALWNPVFTTGILGVGTLCLAAVCFVALVVWKLPAWSVVIAAGVVGAFAF